jgi:hypothetical protein
LTKAITNTIRSVAYIIKSIDTNTTQDTPHAAKIFDSVDHHISSTIDALTTSMNSVMASASQKIISNIDDFITQAKTNIKKTLINEITSTLTSIVTDSTNKITKSAKSYSDIIKNNTTTTYQGQSTQGLIVSVGFQTAFSATVSVAMIQSVNQVMRDARAAVKALKRWWHAPS